MPTLDDVIQMALHDIRLLEDLASRPSPADTEKTLEKRGLKLSQDDLEELETKLTKATRNLNAKQLVEVFNCLTGRCDHDPVALKRGKAPVWQ